MAYKKIDNYFSFADIAIQNNADKNRSLIFLNKVNATIDWKPVQEMLIKFYETGKSKKGERAYSPLLLFKCMLLQKWFQIKSDPELESQINDRISFKSFLDMPLDYPSPDHSTFSRFRKRLSKDAMVQINSVLLKQFYQLGISINKGVAVDARLVKSASKPVSKKKIKILKEKHDTPEGRLDKNGNTKKFTRDIDSDWTFNLKVTRKNDEYHYGLKEHAAVDTDNGFILSTTLSSSSHHDSKYLPYAVIYSMHTKDKIQTVYADKGYRARFPQTMKNTIDIMFRQFAFNLRKGAKILGVLPV